MEKLESKDKVEQQVHFWSVLGPFIILLSLVILVFKVSSDQLYFPLGALIGVPLCLKWKAKGLAGALGVLLALLFYSYADLPLEDRYWHVGMAIALALSFVVLTLSVEEVQGIVQSLQIESKSRLDHLFRLDEKLKISQNEWAEEKKELLSRVEALSQDVVTSHSQQQTLQKLSALAKEELITFRADYEKLLQLLEHRNQQLIIVDSKLQESEASLKYFLQIENNGFSNSSSQNKEGADELVQQRDLLENTVAKLLQEKEETEVDLKATEEQNRQLQEKLKEIEKLGRQRQQELENIKNQFENLTQEKQSLDFNYARLQSDCDALRLQEKQQKFELQQIQSHAQTLKEIIETKERELSFSKEQKRHSDIVLSQRESELRKHIEELNHKWKEAIRQFEQEKEWLNQQLKVDKEILSNQIEACQKESTEYRTQFLRTSEQLEEAKTRLLQLQSDNEMLQLNLDQLEQERNALKQFKEHAAHQSAVIQRELEQCQKQLERKTRLLEEASQAVRTSQQQKEELELMLEEAKSYQAATSEKIAQDLHQLKEQAQTHLYQLEDKQSVIEALKKQLESKEQEKRALLAGQGSLEEALKEKESQIEAAEKSVNELQQTKEALEAELSQLNYASKVKTSQPVSESSRYESMYKQLKDQFEEKSRVLDTTRRELFLAQESLLALQNDWKELHAFDITEGETLMQRELSRAYQEIENIRSDYQQEVDQLHGLIQDLLSGKNS